MNASVQWPDKSLPVAIYCAPGVLTALEIVSTEGLLAMPRIGLGIGGLLLGRRSADRIDILRSIEIPCSHACGPSFMLTPDELTGTLALPESPDDDVDKADRQVVGWYCSKPHSSAELTGHDHELFDAFCPDIWQALLLIRPIKGKPTKAAFGFRKYGDSGKTFTQGDWLDLAWQELLSFEVPEPGLEPVVVPPFVKAAAAAAAEATPAPPPPQPIVRAPELPEDIPVAMPSVGTLFGEPGPRHVREAKEAKAAARPRPKKQKAPGRPWKTNLLFVGILLLVLAMAALLIRGIIGNS